MTVPASWAKLTMYDRIMHSLIKAGAATAVAQQRFREARPFVITPRAAERIGEAMAAYPELLADNSQFAIPPFETMWIEFPARVMLHRERLSGTPIDDRTSDVNVGYLIKGNTVAVLSEGEDLQPLDLPIRYRLHRTLSRDEQMGIANWFGIDAPGAEPVSIDRFLWGHAMYKTLDSERQRALRSQHSLAFDGKVLNSSVSDATRHDVFRGSAGELRNILAVLLMINQPAKIIEMSQVARRRGIVKGRQQVYWGHSLIDINLDRKRKVNLFARPRRGEGNFHLRWHEVRGHFVHYHANEVKHAHLWLPDRDSDRRWHCAHAVCRARRVWREYPNGHGTATTGFVDQVRRIKTKEDRT